MAEKWKAALKEKGPSSVGMFMSGQSTIWEGYAAVKLMKAGFRSNNIDPNARHCMASAAVGFMRTFGMDEPMGCYDDIEHADAFVLWGSNMAEMHPILWQRVADRRLAHPHVHVAVLSTFEHRSYELADLPITFRPQTDLAILNYIANYIIQNKAVNRDFVDKHVAFKLGNDDIGYGLRPEHALQKKAKNAADPGGSKPISFDEYAPLRAKYDVELRREALPASRPSGCERLAQLYADPKMKVMSFWTMGFNQHTRGVWANHLVYNLHLLTGKISTPGNSPFSLTGQPSACGTAREVGVFSHRLPADMVVTNPKHRAMTEEIWKLPAGHDPGEARLPRRAAEPDAEGRPAQLLLDADHQQRAGGRRTRRRRSGPASATRTTSSWCPTSIRPSPPPAPISSCPRRCGWRRKARSATPSGARSSGSQLVNAPGEARSDLWQIMEFSKRFRMEEVWPAELLAKKPAVPRQDALSTCSSRNGEVDQFPDHAARTRNTRTTKPKHFGFYVHKGLFEEYAKLRPRPRPRPRAVRHLSQGARPALAGGERQGNALALPRRLRSLREAGHRLPVLRQPGQQGLHLSRCRTSRRRSRPTRNTRCGSSPAACSSTGTRAR